MTVSTGLTVNDAGEFVSMINVEGVRYFTTSYSNALHIKNCKDSILSKLHCTIFNLTPKTEFKAWFEDDDLYIQQDSGGHTIDVYHRFADWLNVNMDVLKS